MKKIIQKLLKDRNAKINLLLIFALLFTVGLGCTLNRGSSDSDDDVKKERKTDEDDDSTTEDDEIEIDASTGKVPSEEALIYLAKTTMNDFAQATKDDDFEDFYDNLSEAWQKQTSPSKLEKLFKVFIENNGDVRKITSMEPELTGRARIRREAGFKMLNVNGYYDTSPRNVKFELKYIPEGKDWKLSGIRVNTKD